MDRTGVHPESYALAELILREGDLSEGEEKILREAGAFTVEDIRKELEKPGRDPRGDTEDVGLRRSALTMEELIPGLELEGVVKNVVDFGAFIDIGVKKEGLLHISKMKGKGSKGIYNLLKVGDRLNVVIEKVDKERGRISLDIKN